MFFHISILLLITLAVYSAWWLYGKVYCHYKYGLAEKLNELDRKKYFLRQLKATKNVQEEIVQIDREIAALRARMDK